MQHFYVRLPFLTSLGSFLCTLLRSVFAGLDLLLESCQGLLEPTTFELDRGR